MTEKFKLIDKGTSIHLMRGEEFVLSLLKTHNEIMVDESVSVIFDTRKTFSQRVNSHDIVDYIKLKSLRDALEEALK